MDVRSRGVFYTDGTNSTPGGWEGELARAYGAENITPLDPRAEDEAFEYVQPEIEQSVEIDIPDDASDEQIYKALRAQAPRAPEETIWEGVRDIRSQMVKVTVGVTDSVQVTEGMTTDDVLEQLGDPVEAEAVPEEVVADDKPERTQNEKKRIKKGTSTKPKP